MLCRLISVSTLINLNLTIAIVEMKLIYAYVRSFKNIQEQEFMLSDDYDVFFEDNRLTIDKTDNAEVKDFLYGNNLIKDLHIIVGRTGSGKTNLLQLIGMSYNVTVR